MATQGCSTLNLEDGLLSEIGGHIAGNTWGKSNGSVLLHLNTEKNVKDGLDSTRKSRF